MVQDGQLSLCEVAAFDGRPGTIATARDFAAEFLARAQAELQVPITDRVTDAVRLVVSELITNATKYAPGPHLLELQLSAETARVTVWDTEATLPVLHDPDARRIGQHGLEIVRALCDRLEAERRAGGKRICALISMDG